MSPDDTAALAQQLALEWGLLEIEGSREQVQYSIEFDERHGLTHRQGDEVHEQALRKFLTMERA